ncbi:MAG TPA: serine hydrolase domain-containing protein [Bacteroidales bacterium]|jgi:CubicO group peptidase (beta-lactamase class C family)|nr:beta-lactamase family protein [Bacteroidales bacterium]MBP7873446.1 beta-lactamase family protein [Bacteroidales bacterium]MCZ2281599.1 beta-lactamase family protein [Bacteroidales bacterium]HPX33806.1 serine hydrolase domain-containing protein [Bacteroidales bacterium]
MTTEKEKSLQAHLDKVVDGKKVFGTSFAFKKDTETWQGASGNLTTDRPYFIASTTKLFTTAIIMKLRAEGKLSLEDKISKYIDASILSGLHFYKGKDYSQELTIRHLLSHTSGLSDYFQDKGASGKSLENELMAGNDQFWTFEESIDRSKKMSPLFVPGTKGKAKYSDANFQLLGKIIETITGKSYAENCQDRIIQPLSLTKTYLYQDATDEKPKMLYHKSKELKIPKAMTSFGPDGGMVSVSADMLVFIEAFFTGKLFPLSYIDELQEWNRIFPPMRAGVGIHLFKLPWIFDPTGAIPYFIGHSGLSGALAFYSPKENIYIAGTVNQTAHPDISYRTMISLTQRILKK